MFLWFVLIVWLSALIFGCSTVTPRVVKSSNASWDGGSQNSGLIGWTPEGFAIVTPHLRDRYNSMIETYGTKFKPPVIFDYGVISTPSNAYLLTPEAAAHFSEMNRMRVSK